MAEQEIQQELDPVCKMRVLPEKAAAKTDWLGKTYYFCRPGCKDKFAAEPEKYLEADKQHASHEHKHNSSAAVANYTLDLKTFYLPESAMIYVCPMHPEQTSKKPGSCAICGMALEAAIPGSEAGGSDELSDYTRRFFTAVPFTVALLLLSMPEMFGIMLIPIPHSLMPYAELVLTLPVVLYSGLPLFAKALDSLRQKQLNMFTLIGSGVSISFFVSLAMLLLSALESSQKAGQDMLYFESAASIITLVLLGQILELRARRQSSGSLESLFALAPAKARRALDSGSEEEIAVFDLAKGDKLRVLPGDKFPADGRILSGRGFVQESLLSGNSLPVSKKEGDRVLAGTINGDGSMLMEADSLGRQTVFAQIIEMLASAQRSRSPLQEFADRVSAIFIPSVLLIATLTFIAWLALDQQTGLQHAIKDTISVLVIACPCALGLASPIAVSVAVAKAASFGLLVKDARALELLGTVSDLALDKTGTLTKGEFELSSVTVAKDGLSENDAIRIAASLERESKHPLAASIVQSASQRQITLVQGSQITAYPGLGISGQLDSETYFVGNAQFLKAQGLSLDSLDSLTPTGSDTRVYLGRRNGALAVLALTDSLKPESAAFVEQIKSLGIRPQILSGDAIESVAAAGKALGIAQTDLHGNLMPADKVKHIEELQKLGRSLAMIGDGINDAAALKKADVGIAMSGGSDIALSTAPITAMNDKLINIARGVRLSRIMTARMKENLFLAFAYNVLALLFATGIFYPLWKMELDPAMAEAAMSMSSHSVILNSMRIKLAKL